MTPTSFSIFNVPRLSPCTTNKALAVAAVSALLLGLCAGAQPLLPGAFGPGEPGAAGAAPPGTDLFRFDLNDPAAVCNDGTPALMFVRRASELVDINRWQIHLQGGGGCRDGQSCAQRWRSIDTNFGASKMSNFFAPTSIDGRGILSTSPENNFATWNHVYLYYCSSDSWSGRGHDVVTSADTGAGPIPYRIHFHGADILDVSIGNLRGAGGGVTYSEDGEIQIPMPDLDDATDVILSGSSAGGTGVVKNADRIFDVLRSNNNQCATPEDCPLRLAAVVDASYSASLEGLDHSTSTLCSNQGLCTYDDLFSSEWTDVSQGFWSADGEDSCLAAHAATLDQWRCADSTHLLENHLAGPFFVRMDTQDSLLGPNFVGMQFSLNSQLVTMQEFGEIVEQQLLAIEDIALTSEEPRAAGPLEPPGAFGAQCQHHVTISADGPFLRLTAPLDLTGAPITTNDLLWSWYNATGSREAIEPFMQAGSGGVCMVLFESGFETGDTTEWSSTSP